MERAKELFIFIRNGMAFIFSWLVICSIIYALAAGSEVISVYYFMKLFVLCLWGVAAFTVCFKGRRIPKKGFVFSLTIFYILFIPAEIVMFYAMGIFTGKGSMISWIIFGCIAAVLYLTSLAIDCFIMKKRAVEYTEKLKKWHSGTEVE